MTFTPSVLSQIDSNNSVNIYLASPYNGTYTTTTGYNALQISIYNTASSGKLEIYFSPDEINVSHTLTDNYSGTDTNEIFNKRYDILDKYYRIKYTSSNTGFSITSRLCTDSLNSENNSFSAFDNNTEYTRDAFGKLRVSNPSTLLDLRFPYIPSSQTGNTTYLSNNIQLSLATQGTGTSTTTKNSNLILGLNTTSSPSYSLSQSRNYCTYLPGKSILIKASCIMDAGSYNTSGVISQVGYFDDYNGLYFQYTADGSGTGTVSVNLKKTIILSDTITITITQSNWNIDPMNGTGSSGIKLDFTKAQLFVIDFEWLGVGRVRFGFYVYGKILYCHEILNINFLTNNPYMSSSNLPIRHRIQSSGSGQTGSMIQICSTVISEGGYEPIGRPFGIANTSGVSVGSEAPILAIRGGSTAGNYYHQNIVPNIVNFVDTGNNNVFTYRIRLYKDGNLPGTISWSDVDTNNSIVQYANATSITSFTSANSIVVNQGLFAGKASVTYGDLSNTFNSQVLQLTSNYNNQPDILVLTAELISSGSSPNVIADINWNEYI